MTLIKPYSKNTVTAVWANPYISKKMVEYHLQTDNDVASRNIGVIKKTVKFIVDKYKLNRDTSLCDLGCAVGHYTNLFEQEGMNVTGVDISANSIAYAKEQNKYVEYIVADYLEYKPSNKFDFVTMIYCDFGALSNDGRGIMLDNVNEMLTDDGIFMFDIWSYKFYEEVEKIDREYIDTDGLYMKGKCKIRMVNHKYEDLHLILTHTKAKGSHKKMEVYLWDKFFNVDEITGLLNEHGLEIVDLYNNTYGETYKEDSYCITIACKKV